MTNGIRKIRLIMEDKFYSFNLVNVLPVCLHLFSL